MTMAEFVLMCRGDRDKYYRDFAKHRLTAYMVYCSVPKKGRNMPLDKWMPLPTDPNYKPKKVHVNEIKESWEYWKQKAKEQREKKLA